jgi:hypothetical protein
MKTSDLLIQLVDKIVLANKTMEQEIARVTKNNEMQRLFLGKVNEVIPSLVSTLAKEHLEIMKINTSKTGGGDDWRDEDYMHVSLTLEPTSDKFKFIHYSGYTGSGSGKNYKQLSNRASKLSEKIKNGTGLTSVSVNPYSFEIRGDKSSNLISIEFWVK